MRSCESCTSARPRADRRRPATPHSERNPAMVALRPASVFGLLLAACWSIGGLPSDPAAAGYWAQERGPYATGVSRRADPPIEWSETSNVRWKVEIPGRGSGTPVIWDNKVFVLSAIPVGIAGAEAHAPQGA